MHTSRMILGAAAVALMVGLPQAGDAQSARSRAFQAQPFTQAEKTQGAQSHTEIMQEFGDAYTGPQANYVRQVGQNIAMQSGLASSPTEFTVTLLNSPVNNAFALPGGYVYATRQLLALMNNEAELAGVLGHEVGHTAARHARQRQSAAQRNSILGVVGSVLGGLLGDNGGLLGGLGGLLQNNAMRVAQMATLGFSRSQETEADDLGIQYLAQAGYDPNALSTMLASLAAQNTLDAQASGQPARAIPEWASTHPDPASRVRRALQSAQRYQVPNGRLNRDQFLTAVNGVMYGDDPRQGVVEGQNFLHPDMRLRFTVPQGFAMQNGTQAVTVAGSNGQAMFTAAAYSGDMDSYIQRALQGVAGQNSRITPGQTQRTTVNGIPATYSVTRATNNQGQQLDVTIFAYEFARDKAYHFAAITPAGQANIFNGMFNSVRRMSAAEAQAIRPRRVSVVTVGPRDTVASLSSRMAYTNLQQQRFMVLNGLDSNARLTPGQRVKLVVYGS